MEKFRDFLTLVRWQNVLMIAVTVYVMEKWVATPILCAAYFGEQLPWYVLLLMTMACCLIAAGGYVINDYFDVKIDAINRPDRLIVTRSVSKRQAMQLFQMLTALGLLCGIATAWLVRSWILGVVFVFVPGLLWFYSASYKRLLLIGNLTIALVTALTPLIVAMANVAYLKHLYSNMRGHINVLDYTTLPHDIYLWLGGFAAFAFIGTLIREIIKDMEDQQGDRELECHSLPVVFGDTATKVIVTLLILTMAAAIVWLAWWVIPSPMTGRYAIFGLLIPLICVLYLLWKASIPSDYRTTQRVMKFVLFMGVMFSFVVTRLL